MDTGGLWSLVTTDKGSLAQANYIKVLADRWDPSGNARGMVDVDMFPAFMAYVTRRFADRLNQLTPSQIIDTLRGDYLRRPAGQGRRAFVTLDDLAEWADNFLGEFHEGEPRVFSY